jgi:ribose 5-phosphate isomerase B
MKIYLGSDHAGFQLKEQIKLFLQNDKYNDYDIVDDGAFTFNQQDDYPDFIQPVAKKVADDWKQKIKSRGIIFGGSGQGEAMVANRQKGVRAVVYYGGSLDIIKLSRQHNRANILSIGARFVDLAEAKKVVQLWLTTDFSGKKRHLDRIAKF